MKLSPVFAAVVTLTLTVSSGDVFAKRVFDNPNYGYCPGSLIRVVDVRWCRSPGPHSGQCPPGTFSKFGRSWAWDVRNCR